MPAPSDDLTTIAAYPVALDFLHNILLVAGSSGAALGFWNGQAAAGALGVAFTVAAAAASAVHVHKTSVLARILGSIQDQS